MLREEREEKGRKLIPEIAKIMGWEYIKSEHERDLLVKQCDEHEGCKMTISITISWREDKLVIYPFLPNELVNHKPYNAKPIPTINVSINKTAEQIAKDINNRALPGYMEILVQSIERKKAFDEQEGKKLATMQTVAALLGVEFKQGYDRNNYQLRNYKPVYFIINGDYSNRTKWDVEVPVGKWTNKMAEFVKGMMDEIAKEEGEGA